jgi:hypothetical protein
MTLEPIAYTEFTDGTKRPVFEDERGQLVFDDDGNRVPPAANCAAFCPQLQGVGGDVGGVRGVGVVVAIDLHLERGIGRLDIDAPSRRWTWPARTARSSTSRPE